jgi:NADH-ubiquinone oxidoreductase chain 1
MLAVSSLATYGILLAGWSANSKYAFLGSLRSTAQLISYELIISSTLLLMVLLTGTLNLSVIIETQKIIWFIIPLLPLFIIFFIASVAETNRAPFDLAEAESELVSGFMTEHSAGIFVFFFLAEYASIILMCILISIVLIGGYNLSLFTYIIEKFIYTNIEYWLYNIIYSFEYIFSLGLKTCILIFTFIWVRASYPRIRFDQLMSYCWTVLFPIIISLITCIPCILYNKDILIFNISLL